MSDYHSATMLRIQMLNDCIKVEFDLITARIGWLVTAEAFIFSGVAACIVGYSNKLPYSNILQYLVFMLPILGIMLALIVYLAILAAHSAIKKLKRQRSGIIHSLPASEQIILIGPQSIEHVLGEFPPIIIPPIIILIWVGALLTFVL